MTLRISQENTKVLRINSKQEEPIPIEGAPVEVVSEFVYLGSKINKSGGSDQDITARSKKSSQAFAIHRPVWKSTAISTRTKLCLFSSNGKRKRGRLKQTWKQSILDDLRTTGLTCEAAKKHANDRKKGKSTVQALCSTRGKRD
uniref:DUF6451 domain-containing protein n=1 Tax=Octopus bimaculoides TaxID=37653 RepID=A0A0L8GID5_OCTBM